MNKGYKKSKAVKAGYLGDSPVEMKPMISIDSSMLPDIKKWKIDKTYKVVVELRMTGIHERGDDKLCGDFEIVTAELEDKD